MGIVVHIVDVSRQPAPSVLLRVSFPSGEETLIRWGLDNKTYGALKRAVEDTYFDSLADHESLLPLTYQASGPKGDPGRKVYAHVEKVSGHRRKQLDVECSERFAGNLRWFRESVRCPQDVAHLVVSEP